ncbi:MAG: ribosomal L7Ae/L30e/S12e/Gadd45 family protein [Nanoarchaeota archaeon]
MAKESEQKETGDMKEIEYSKKKEKVKRRETAKGAEDTKEVKELKDKIQAGKLIIGSKMVLKAIRNKSLQRVFLASNCPVKEKDNFKRYSALAGIPLAELALNSEELGLLCKKGFLILALGTKE